MLGVSPLLNNDGALDSLNDFTEAHQDFYSDRGENGMRFSVERPREL